MGKSEDEDLKRAAQLLLEGASMTQIPCPQCGLPIYQKRDQSMICASCNLPVIKEEAETQTDMPISNSNPIQLKIDQLALELQNETDFTKIKEISETIRSLEKIRDS